MHGAEVLKNVQFVFGGARSGKSRFAERLARHAAGGVGQLFYVATAQPFDAEMRSRIAQHVEDRAEGWTTVEAPMALPEVIAQRKVGEIVLIDCLTLWLSNILLADGDMESACADLMNALAQSGAHFVCVSNELGMGLVPDNYLGRKFRDAQGRLNQMVAARSDLAILVAAGLPLVLKGTLPQALT